MSEFLRITELFYSLQGEGGSSGKPTIFIRLTGCPLRCGYCDTSYAFSGGDVLSIEAVIGKIQQWRCRLVTVTGGEPLAQPDCQVLLKRLCDLDYEVSLETSGALDVSKVDPRVIKVMDLKTPGSGELHQNLYTNIEYLTAHDQVKFVICDRSDYEWSKFIIDRYRLADIGCELLFSGVHGQQSATELADWILQDELVVRFQIQLHKYLWGDKPGV